MQDSIMSTEKRPEGQWEDEPSSFTHPKPCLNDSDTPIQKRRRTASPGSVRPSTETVEPHQQQPSQPRTPSPTSATSPEEPTSTAKLSLNIRRASNSSSSPTKSELLASEGRSVEYDADASARDGSTAVRARQSSSSAPDSPLTSTDDGIAQSELAGITQLGQETLASMTGTQQDPSRQLPLHDSSRKLTQEAVMRLRHYAQEGYAANALDHATMVQVNEWIQRNIAYFKSASKDEVLQSIHLQYEFWEHFPAYLELLLTIRYEVVHGQPDLLSIMADMSTEVARLATLFIRFDPELWQRFPDVRQASKQEFTYPLSFRYLKCFEVICDYFPLDIYERVRTAFGFGGPDILVDLNTLTLACIELLPDRPGLASIVHYLTRAIRRTVASQRGRRRPDTSQGQVNVINALDSLWATVDSHLKTLLPLLSPYDCGDALDGLLAALKFFGGCEEAVNMYKATKTLCDGLGPLDTRDSRDFGGLVWFVNHCLWVIRSTNMKLQSRLVAAEQLGIALYDLWKTHHPATDGSGVAPILSRVCDFLIQGRITDTFFDTSCHPQLIAHSVKIVGFLVASKRFSTQHREQLWQAIRTCQDLRTSEKFYEVFETYIFHSDMVSMAGLMRWFQETPLQDWTAGMHTSCRFAINRVLTDPTSSWAQQPYDLCVWFLQQSYSPRVTPFNRHTISDSAVRDIENLWAHEPMERRKQRKREIAATCMIDVASDSDTRLGSLRALGMIFAGEDRIADLLNENELLDVVVNELQRAASDSASAPSTEPILSGGLNFPRCLVIGKLIGSASVRLTRKHWESVWSVLVGAQTRCQSDREAGWEILSQNLVQVPGSEVSSPYYADLLSTLQPDCYCEGLLHFLKRQIMPVLATGIEPEVFDSAHASIIIEQLWRILHHTQDDELATKTAHVLAFDIYLDSPGIRTLSIDRVHMIHSVVLARCLEQVHASAPRPNAARSIEQTEPNGQRLFSRSLKLLQLFITHCQQDAQSRLPDIRCYMYRDAPESRGDPTSLFYQAFEDTHGSDVQELALGKSNTVADLLTKLGKATGFKNCRIFFRGRLLPSERDSVHMTLEQAGIVEGLCLVKWAEPLKPVETRVRHGSSFIEVEVSRWFDKILPILDLEDEGAGMIYNLLIKLPADQHVIRTLTTGQPAARDLIPLGRPLRSLYALHAMREYMGDVRLGLNIEVNNESKNHCMHGSLICLRLVSAALTSRAREVVVTGWEAQVLCVLLATYRQLLSVLGHKDVVTIRPSLCSTVDLVKIFAQASSRSEDSASEALLENAISTIMAQGRYLPGVWEELNEHRVFCELMCMIMVQNSKQRDRTLVAECLITATDQEPDIESTAGSSSPKPSPLVNLLWNLLSQCLPDLRRFPEHSSEVKALCLKVLSMMKKRYPNEAKSTISQVAATAAQALSMHKTTETYMCPSHIDIYCRNMAFLLDHCLRDNDYLAKSNELQNHRLAWAIFSNLLFSPNPVLTSNSRSMLYEIILILVASDTGVRAPILQRLHDALPYDPDEQMPYSEEFAVLNLDHESSIRPRGGYVGLNNPSNVCYLNSLVQQLFMNRGLRRFILTLPKAALRSNSTVFAALQRLMTHMQNSWEHHIEHEEFLAAITIDGEPLNIHVQMDVDEFYNVLLDNLENDIRGSLEKFQLRAFFSGESIQQIKSMECCHISERREPFMTIQCDVSGKAHLAESLRAYVEGEKMEGENSYKCESCDNHVAAVKRTCLKTIPDYLTLSLKRFEYDLYNSQRYKIDSRFEFPEGIDMAPYTIDALSNDGADVDKDIFDLVGILVHSGTAETGHYYSFIRERASSETESRWFEFNDRKVTEWDPVNIPEATFGGDKSYSAYMLFYQRRTSFEPPQTGGQVISTNTEVPVDRPTLRENISRGNRLLLRRHCFYEDKYAHFVWVLCKLELEREDASKIASDVSLPFSVLLSHLDQVICRSKRTPVFNKYKALLLATLTGPGRAKYKSDFVAYFTSRPESFRWLLMRNPDPIIRRFTGDLMILCLKRDDLTLVELNTSSASTKGDENALKENDLSKMISIMRRLWQYFHVGTRAWEEVFGFISQFAQLSTAHVNLLLKEDWLANLLRMVIRDATEETSDMFRGMLRNLAARADRPPSWGTVFELLSYLLSRMEPVISLETIVDSAEERDISPDGHFSWTADEVNLLSQTRSEEAVDGLFATKLIEMDVACAATDEIIGRLIRTGGENERMVLYALLRNLRASPDLDAPKPFVRAAASFARHSSDGAAIKKLHLRMIKCAFKVRTSDCDEYLAFFEALLDHKDDSLYLSETCLGDFPNWVPCLLACTEESVRYKVTTFLSVRLFEAFFEGRTNALESCQLSVVVQLGWACLNYLREYHIDRDREISRDIARDVVWVVTRCEIVVSDYAQLLESAPDLTEARIDVERKLAISRELNTSIDENDWPTEISSDDEDLVA